MVAVTADKVVVELEARLGRYNANVNSARQNWERSMGSIRSSGARTETAVAGQFRTIAASIFTVYTARQVQLFLDAATRIQNSLKVAGLSGEELERVYGKLFESAQRNAAPLETLAQLYGRAALAQKELGASTDELLNFTEKVAVALRVSGKSAEESRGALIQLSQAIGSGIVRAEEFNAILEGALPIAQAAAAGLEEAGGSVAKLRTLIINGKVSSEAFFRAFEAGAVILDEKVAGAQFTVEQQFLRLTNSAINAAGAFNDVNDVSGKIGSALSTAADAVDDLATAFRDSNSPINVWLERARKVVETFLAIQKFTFNLTTLGLFAGEAPKFDRTSQSARRRSAGYGESKPKTVSLENFPIDGTGTDKEKLDAYERAVKAIKEQTLELNAQATAADRSAVALARTQKETELLNAAFAAGKKDTKALREEISGLADDYAKAYRADQFEDLMDGTRAAITDVRHLADAYGKTAVEADTLAFKQNLLNQAMEIAGEVTPEMRRRIEEVTEAYRVQREATEQVIQAQKREIELADGVRDGLLDIGTSALRGADDFGDAVGRMLQQIAELAFQLYVLKPLIESTLGASGTGFGGGLGGAIASLFGGSAVSTGAGSFNYQPTMGGGFASGTANTGGRRGEPRGIVHGQEAVIPLPAGGKVPVELRIPPSLMMAPAASPEPQQVNINVNVEGANGDAHVIDLVRQGVTAGITQYDGQLNRTMGQRILSAQRRQL